MVRREAVINSQLRRQFTIYVIGNQTKPGLLESLHQQGYATLHFQEFTEAFSEILSHPPHIILFSSISGNLEHEQEWIKLKTHLPETHFFVSLPWDKKDLAKDYYDMGFEAVLYEPTSEIELCKQLDRALAYDLLVYKKEKEQPVVADTKKFFKCQSVDQLVGEYFNYEAQSTSRIVFLKYFSIRRTLVVQSTQGFQQQSFQGMGIDFNKSSNGFQTRQLEKPAQIGLVKDFVKSVFRTETFWARPIECLNEFYGVLIYLEPETPQEFSEQRNSGLECFDQALKSLELEKRYHSAMNKDVSTDVMSRAQLLVRLEEEVSRSRRLNLPTSLLVIRVDAYQKVMSQLGLMDSEIVMRAVAKILAKHIRVNDLLGRLGPDEFGLILAHTPLTGAMIKADRLRRTLESGDFSRVIKDFSKITVTVTVSEYPSHCRDSFELLLSAQETLDEVRNQSNLVHVAQAPEGFVPDFAQQ